ncbi:MAG: hypothetical protein ACJ0PS_05410 [Flavobacteriaceae bacterium]
MLIRRLKIKTPSLILFFNKLAGQRKLQEQIKNDIGINEIKKSWEPELKKFKSIRSNYLLYQ